MDLLFLFWVPFQLLIAFPGLAFVPAVALGLLTAKRWRRLTRSGRVFAAIGVAAWFAYAVWETWMYYWMRTVIAPIRVDLMILVPLLYIAAAIVLYSCFNRRVRSSA